MTEYRFYGNENAPVRPISAEYSCIRDQRHLYDILSGIWCEYTCAPRMRAGWSKADMTRGQCSITAFLAQDIFGGRVFGVPREGGNFHCFNVVGDSVFDLTSEQFHGEKLDYDNCPEQLREVHFAKEEKHERYEFLKRELRRYLDAVEYAAKMHAGQMRKDGITPYVVHPIAVSDIVREKGGDSDCIIAALFHDLLEDTEAAEADIERIGGRRVLELVKLLTKPEDHTKPYMPGYVAAIRADAGAFLIKGADRLNNLHDAFGTNDAFKLKYIAETRKYYMDFLPEIPTVVAELEKTVASH